MAITKTQKEMQKCIPFVKELSQKDLDKEKWHAILMEQSASLLISILAILEIGRDNFLADSYKTKANPEAVFSKHSNVTKRQQEHTQKGKIVEMILNKILLCKYMETAYTVLSLKNLDTNENGITTTENQEIMVG